MSAADLSAARQLAVDFATSLGQRCYDRAHAMTTPEFRQKTTAAAMSAEFEAIVPTDWGPVGPIEVGETMEAWPGRQDGDLAWLYVSIGGEVYSEALTVVVTRVGGELRIREVEFGRP